MYIDFYNKKTISKFYLSKVVFLFFILFTIESTSQISYSCDMESCGSVWDNNGFGDGSSYSGGCSGDGLYDNVYGTGTSQVVGAWNASAITGHAGGELTVTVKTKLRDYYSTGTDNTSSDWGNLKVYYKSSTPS